MQDNTPQLPLFITAPCDPDEERFWLKTDKRGPDDCWEWQGGKDACQYGRIHMKSRRHTLAHRYSYELHNGPIPNGLLVLHECDNPPCVNPKHLFLGTKIDNNADKSAKGRQARGVGCGISKFTEDDIRDMRQLHANGISQQAIAVRYNTDSSNVSYIVRHKTWRHVT